MSQWIGILLFVAVILTVVLIHEGGHFLFAKAFKIKVEQFFVGFGPRLWSIRRGETEYGVKMLPLGGYVRIAGMNPFEDIPPEEFPRTFGAKPAWQRALVIGAGPITHFLMAAIFFFIFFAAIGAPSPSRPVIESVQPRLSGQPSPASVVGLRPGDLIVAVAGRPVGSSDRFIAYTRAHVGTPISVTVERDGRRITVEATPVLSDVGGTRVGRLGVTLGLARERVNPLVAAGRSVVQTASTIKQVVLELGHVFGPAGIHRIGQLLLGSQPRRANDATSIVGGAQLAGEAVKAGAWDFLFGILIVFNVFVGVLNLVPLPPLDGGHLAIIAYEKVVRRRLDPRKLVPLTAVVAGFIVLLAVSLAYIDITNPLPNPFH